MCCLAQVQFHGITSPLHQHHPAGTCGNVRQAVTVEYLPQLFSGLLFLIFEGVDFFVCVREEG